MNKNLFHDLANILISNSNQKLTKIDCFVFFTNGLISTDECNIRNTINDKRALPRAVYQLQSDFSWNLSDISCSINTSQLFHELCNLYRRYINDVLPQSTLSFLLDSLIRTCLFDDPNPQKIIPFAPSQTLIQYNSDAFYGRREELLKVHEILSRLGKIIIKGPAGIGKTMFAKQYFRTYKTYYTEATFITYSENIVNTLSRIKFQQDPRFGGTYSEITEQLQQKTCHHLLIIDSMNCSPEQFAEEITTLSSLPLHVIITAREYVPTDTITAYNLASLNAVELYNIFCMYNPDTKLSSEKLSQLFQVLSFNTLAVSLISKSFSRMKISLEQLIQGFKQPDFKMTSNFPEIKHDYTRHEYKYFGHISTIYYQIDLDEKDRSILRKLSIFSDSVLPVSELKRWIPEIGPLWISEMFSLGIISYYSSSCIQIHPLISDVIFQKERPTILNCLDLVEHLHADVQKHYQNLYLPDMQDIIYCALNRLNHTYLSGLTSEQKKQWLLFTADSIKYFLDCNNAEKAWDFLDELDKVNINHPESSLVIGLKIYLKIYASWVNGDINTKFDFTDELIRWLRDGHFDYFQPLMSRYFSLELDKIVYDTLLLNNTAENQHKVFHKLCLYYSPLCPGNESMEYYSYIDTFLEALCKPTLQKNDWNGLMDNLEGFTHFSNTVSDPFLHISSACFLVFIQFTLIHKFLKHDTDTPFIAALIYGQEEQMNVLDNLVESCSFFPSYITNICIAAYFYLPISFPTEKAYDYISQIYYSFYMERLQHTQKEMIKICSSKIKLLIPKSPLSPSESLEIQNTLKALCDLPDMDYALLE